MLLGDVISLNPRRTPDRIALVVGKEERTYGELETRRLRLANALLGVASPGDRVAILAENVPEYVECYFGVPTAGILKRELRDRYAPR